MKRISLIMNNRFVLEMALLLGIFLLFPSLTFAQDIKKNGRHDKVRIEKTLPETEIVARLSVSAIEIEPLKVQIDLLNPSGKRATVGIFNDDRQYVFLESFTTRDYHRAFNFNKTSPGSYAFVMRGKKSYEYRPFKIEEHVKLNVMLIDQNQQQNSEIISKIYEIEPNKLALHIDNAENDLIKVVFKNKRNHVVHQEYMRGEQIFKIYDLRSMKEGAYTMIVKNGNNMISQDLKVDNSIDRTFTWVDRRGRAISPSYVMKNDSAGKIARSSHK